MEPNFVKWIWSKVVSICFHPFVNTLSPHKLKKKKKKHKKQKNTKKNNTKKKNTMSGAVTDRGATLAASPNLARPAGEQAGCGNLFASLFICLALHVCAKS